MSNKPKYKCSRFHTGAYDLEGCQSQYQYIANLCGSYFDYIQVSLDYCLARLSASPLSGAMPVHAFTSLFRFLSVLFLMVVLKRVGSKDKYRYLPAFPLQSSTVTLLLKMILDGLPRWHSLRDCFRELYDLRYCSYECCGISPHEFVHLVTSFSLRLTSSEIT